MFLGLPPAPLPDRWWRGLLRRQVLRVIRCELYGSPRVMPSRHHKGYVRLYLGRGHPYADRNGCGTLHRWLMCRKLGRHLEPWEHVHHRNGHKDTWNVEELQVLEAIEHGMFHYGRNFERRNGRMEWVSCGAEFDEAELVAMTERDAPAEDPPI